MHRSSFGQFYQHGSRSPYAAQARHTTDRSMSDFYEYVDDNHNPIAPQGRHDQSVFEDDDQPDVVHVTFRGKDWTVDFPAYSIAEETATVKHLRDRVARHLDMFDQTGRIRLIYKDRDMRRNDAPLRRYGVKQNSEVAVIVSTESRDYDLRRHNSGSDSESATVKSRRTVDDDRRQRSNSIYRRREEEMTYPNGYLHPLNNSSTSSPRHESPSRPYAQRRESPTYTSRPSLDRQHSPVRPSPQRGQSPSTNSIRTTAPAVQPPRADKSTALGKVQAMRYEFHTEYAPMLHKFLRRPPSDKDDRDKEYRRLNEIVYKKVYEPGDAIEPEGSDKEEIRATRKQLYNEAQAVLKELDKFKPHTD